MRGAAWESCVQEHVASRQASWPRRPAWLAEPSEQLRSQHVAAGEAAAPAVRGPCGGSARREAVAHEIGAATRKGPGTGRRRTPGQWRMSAISEGRRIWGWGWG
jgi:hypothetical protein